MPVNWKAPDAFERLLAAMVAAQDMKLDYRKIATFYGQNATYDSIEGRFRIIKKQAAQMRVDVSSGVTPPAPARGSNAGLSSSASSFATAQRVDSDGGSSGSGSGNAAAAKVCTPKKNRQANAAATPSSGRGKKSGDRTVGGRVAKTNGSFNGGAGSPTKNGRAKGAVKVEDDEVMIVDPLADPLGEEVVDDGGEGENGLADGLADGLGNGLGDAGMGTVGAGFFDQGWEGGWTGSYPGFPEFGVGVGGMDGVA